VLLRAGCKGGLGGKGGSGGPGGGGAGGHSIGVAYTGDGPTIDETTNFDVSQTNGGMGGLGGDQGAKDNNGANGQAVGTLQF
jgi:hypothetical protein